MLNYWEFGEPGERRPEKGSNSTASSSYSKSICFSGRNMQAMDKILDAATGVTGYNTGHYLPMEVSKTKKA